MTSEEIKINSRLLMMFPCNKSISKEKNDLEEKEKRFSAT